MKSKLKAKHISGQRAPALDMASVSTKAPPENPVSNPPTRIFGLQDAPCYYPTEKEFMEPLRFIESIRPEAEKAGICKIIPPEGWKPTFALDTEVRFMTSVLLDKKKVQRLFCLLFATRLPHRQLHGALCFFSICFMAMSNMCNNANPTQSTHAVSFVSDPDGCLSFLFFSVLYLVVSIQDQDPKTKLDGGRDEDKHQLLGPALQVSSPAGTPCAQDPSAGQKTHRSVSAQKGGCRPRRISEGMYFQRDLQDQGTQTRPHFGLAYKEIILHYDTPPIGHSRKEMGRDRAGIGLHTETVHVTIKRIEVGLCQGDLTIRSLPF